MSKPYPLEVLCLWEGWQGDKVHESEDLQRHSKMLRGKLQVWVSMLGIYSPKRMSALLNKVGSGTFAVMI